MPLDSKREAEPVFRAYRAALEEGHGPTHGPDIWAGHMGRTHGPDKARAIIDGGMRGPGTNELPLRNQFRAWGDLMRGRRDPGEQRARRG